MKKYYSTILLLAFMVGALQPVLPMIEYHLFEGSLISLFSDRGEAESTDEAMCIAVMTPSSDEYQGEDPGLLDMDYYPIPVKSSGETGFMILPVYGEQFTFVHNKTIPFYTDPSPPPPKVV
ncbi:MAG: hypothetical protein WEA56_12550 [Balneolaceae bacterium]